MNQMQVAVREFQYKFQRTVNDVPTPLSARDRLLRAKLVLSEAIEYVHACGCELAVEAGPDELTVILDPVDVVLSPLQKPNIVERADALADELYVVFGSAVSEGVDLQPVFDIVHATNLAKVGGGETTYGKILKPPGWTPPDIAAELRRQGWRGGGMPF